MFSIWPPLCLWLFVSHSYAAESVGGCKEAIDTVYPTFPFQVAGTDADNQRNRDSIEGLSNLKINNTDEQGRIKDITVFYPAGSYDPGSMIRQGLPYGGIGFKSRLNQGVECLILTYELKFDKNFDFVKGGKLPGLYGGIGNSGGKIPNGHDGFSVRFIWKEQGKGAAYAYLPNSKTWGTALGTGSWSFTVGSWHRIEQKVKLNTPGQSDGEITVWYDNTLVHTSRGLVFRDTGQLKIEGLMFSTFFGGNNATFATPVDTHIEFRNFAMSSQRLTDQ